MRRGDDGEVLARSGWASGFFWVLGMGSRFAFIDLDHPRRRRRRSLSFSAQHSITSQEAWTVALLAMAVFEVLRPDAGRRSAASSSRAPAPELA